MTDFEYDIRQKKSIANQSRYRKRGSKSKKCSLPSDGISYKQWKEMCGPVETYQITKPISWERFKLYPQDVQEQYLRFLRDSFGVTSSRISEMMGVSPSQFCKYCSKHNIKFSGTRNGYRMSAQQLEQWKIFVSDQVEIQANDTELLTQTETADEVHEAPQDMKMRHITLCFSGKINIDGIANSLRYIMLDGRTGQVEIRCDLED